MDPARRELKRYGAPAAFLLAVTIAVLLIKAGLGGSTSATTTAGALPTAAATTTTRATTSAKLTLTTPPVVTSSTTSTDTTATSTTAGRTYTIQSGDTLGGVAAKENTTVDELLRLNPGIDPKTLHVGQQIRVG